MAKRRCLACETEERTPAGAFMSGYGASMLMSGHGLIAEANLFCKRHLRRLVEIALEGRDIPIIDGETREGEP